MPASRIIPKLEKFEYAEEQVKDEHDVDDTASNTANIVVKPTPMHRFANGTTIPSSRALGSKFSGINGSRGAYKLVIQPNYSVAAHGHVEFMMEIRRLMRGNVKVGGADTSAAFKPIKKTDAKSCLPA